MLSETVLTCPDCDGRGMIAKGDARYECEGCLGADAVYTEPTETVPTSPVAQEAAPSNGRVVVVPRAPSATGYHHTSDRARYDGRVLDVGHMLAQPDEPIPWRCEGLAADGYLTVLAGRGGEGKSWMALALACGVARGKPAAGIPCEKGRALIFDSENGPKLIARRFRAAAVTGDMNVQPVDAGGLKLTQDADWFRGVIVAERANLVVFDSLRVLSSGAKESDGDVMEPLITALKQLARDTGAAVLLIHHRGKGESEYRGSSVILDQTDMLFTLGRAHGDPDGRTRRKLATVKCRIDEEPAPKWVSIDADRDRGLVTVNATDPYEGEDGGRPRDQHREDVLGVLGGIPRSERNIAKATGLPRTTVQRLVADLAADGLTVKQADGWVAHLPGPVESGPPGPPSGNHAVEPNRGVVTPLTPAISDEDLFIPNGNAACGTCGALLASFGGRLTCIGCAARGDAR